MWSKGNRGFGEQKNLKKHVRAFAKHAQAVTNWVHRSLRGWGVEVWVQVMGGRHKFKRGGHSVNAKQHLQNTHR